MDRERLQFDSAVRRMAGVLSVVDDQPGPGCVTVRVVAGHGGRIRKAAGVIAPQDLELFVLEDDLVTTVPELPPPGPEPDGPDAPGGRSGAGSPGQVGDDVELRCSYAFCRHRTTSSEFGVTAGDRCRQKIRVTNGWLSCPGHYRAVAPARRRWWGGVR